MSTPQAVLPHRAIGDFLSPASFWFPEYLCESAWLEHAPFACWLVEAHQPALLVELGTHWGFSFFTFCQAVRDLGLATRCFAVDHWQGDDQAGRYGEEVFKSASDYNDAHYAAFAKLMRASFDAAASSFADGSIDLLHIDGRHAYADVSNDVAVWLPKLSNRGVVVFHDVNERQRHFDVWRLWSELRVKYPHFEFPHNHGLGIIGVGGEIGPRLRALLDADADHALSQQICRAYARLGAAVTERIERLDVCKVLERKEADLAGHVAELARVKSDLVAHAAELARVKPDLTAHAAELVRVKADLASHAAELARVKADLAADVTEATRLRADLTAERDHVARASAAGAKLEADLEAVKHSVSWRITEPLRQAAKGVRSLRRRPISRGPEQPGRGPNQSVGAKD